MIFQVFIFLISAVPLFGWQEAFQERVRLGERPAWMMDQIKSDLRPFAKKPFPKEKLDEIAAKGGIVRFGISGKEVIVKGGRENHPHVKIIWGVLSEIAELAPLPPLDLIIALNDSFYHYAPLAGCRGPLFSFAKRAGDRGIILFPDAEALKGYDLKEVEMGQALYPWEQKSDKAFWRGANTGFVNDLSFMNVSNLFQYPRVKLVDLSLKNPGYLDARFNIILHVSGKTADKLRGLGFVGDTVSVAEHLKYKYQILVDGYTCAFARAYWQLFSNSVILKQTSPDVQWYYGRLLPLCPLYSRGG